MSTSIRDLFSVSDKLMLTMIVLMVFFLDQREKCTYYCSSEK